MCIDARARDESQCNKPRLCHESAGDGHTIYALRNPYSLTRRSLRRVLTLNAALAKAVREKNNGPIYGCHHRGNTCDDGHGVVGRVNDVRWRFDGQDLEHTTHVGARGVSGAHPIAAIRCHTIALTRLIARSFRPRRRVRDGAPIIARHVLMIY
jgi:hypothetical protein